MQSLGFLHNFLPFKTVLGLFRPLKELDYSPYYPTNIYNIKGVQLLKHIKIMEAAPTCFGLQRNHHHGATASSQLISLDWFSVDIDVVQTLPVLQRQTMTCVACVLCTVKAQTLAQCTTHVILCRHSTGNVCTTSISTLNQYCNFS